jgi:hypothetical protein
MQTKVRNFDINNLYGYSQNNNIEAGIMTNANLLSNLQESFYIKHGYFCRVVQQSGFSFKDTAI